MSLIERSCAYTQLSTEEQNTVLNAFKNPDNALANGVRLAGTKYFVIETLGSVIRAKKAVSS